MKKHIIFTIGALVVGIMSSMSAFAAEGTLSGASDHETSGTVSVTRDGADLVVTLGDDFSLDGAPDPHVALGHGSRPVDGGIIAVLGSNTGGQTYRVPATAALEAADEVVIWCKQFSVPLGVAAIR